jgi:NAD(P)-dependent dehydrogenase (short-subunit alcohol dehydrogenase family)
MYAVPDQTGRRFIVTGANSGTGKEATKRIAAAGGSVIMAVRSPERGVAARDEILAEAPQADLEVRQLDLADLSSVRTFAETVLSDGHPLDVLINNAGVMAPPNRMETKDGFELQFGSNFLGPFALTNLLLPLLRETPGARVATMTSGTANFGSIHFDDLQSQHRYRPNLAYAQSKLADMLMSMRLADIAEREGWRLLSTMAHPGYTRTNLQSSGANLGRDEQKPPIQRTLLPSQTVEQGAEPLLFAAVDPAALQGAYYGPGGALGLVGPTKRVRIPRSAKREGVETKLWDQAQKLTAV